MDHGEHIDNAVVWPGLDHTKHFRLQRYYRRKRSWAKDACVLLSRLSTDQSGARSPDSLGSSLGIRQTPALQSMDDVGALCDSFILLF